MRLSRKRASIMNNARIIQAMDICNVSRMELAVLLGVSVFTINNRFRYELPDAEQNRYIRLIQGIEKRRGENGTIVNNS